MEDLIIKGTNTTFHVELLKSGNLSFSGVSTPENAKVFMAPVLEWINQLKQNPPNKVVVDFKIDYLNTITTRYMYEIIDSINEMQASQVAITYNWHFEEGDDDLKELGEEFELSTGVKFNYIPY